MRRQYDSASHRIYVAVQTRNQVVAIDPSTDQVVERHDTSGCDHPHGLLIASEQQRAFVACQGNDKLVVLDMTNWQAISTQDVGKSPDVLAMDSSLHLVYVAAENGPLAVFRDDETGVTRIAFQSAGPNAHVVAVDPETHTLYMPLANLNGQPVLRELTVAVLRATDIRLDAAARSSSGSRESRAQRPNSGQPSRVRSGSQARRGSTYI